MHYMGLECGVYVLQKLWNHEILISMYDSVCSVHTPLMCIGRDHLHIGDHTVAHKTLLDT